MDTPRTLITGASRGIGLALARACAERGHRVCATERSPSAALHQLPVRVLQLDVRDAQQITTVRDDVATHFGALDLLINNAGINGNSPEAAPTSSTLRFGKLEPEAVVQMFRVNAVGPMLVTQALVELLERGSCPRVVNVSSRRASLQLKTEGGNYGYCASKAALNMVTRALAADLAPRGIDVVAVHPGEVRTAMGMPDATLTPDHTAARLLDMLSACRAPFAGRYVRTDASELPW